MAANSQPVEEKDDQETTEAAEGKNGKEHSPLFEASRKVLLASVGAIALAQDEIEDFVDRLIERGQVAEQDGRKLIREIADRRKKTAHAAEGVMARQVEAILDRLNVPTKADIQSLGEVIAALTKKVDELKK